MNIIINCLKIMTTMIIIHTNFVANDYTVKDLTGTNPVFIPLDTLITCDIGKLAKVRVYKSYGKNSHDFQNILGELNRIVMIKENLKDAKQTYLYCDTEEYLVKFIDQSWLNCNHSTHLKYNLSYALPGFKVSCEGHGAYNIIFESKAKCFPKTYVLHSTAITLVEINLCNKTEQVNVTAVGIDYTSNFLYTKMSFDVLASYEKSLSNTTSFVNITQQLRCNLEYIDSSYSYQNKAHIWARYRNQVLIGSIDNKMASFSEHYISSEVNNYRYCCERCDVLQNLPVALPIDVVVDYKIFFDVSNVNIALLEIVTCSACFVSSKIVGNPDINPENCRKNDVDSYWSVPGIIEGSLNDGMTYRKVGPAYYIQIPTDFFSKDLANTGFQATCNVGANYKLTQYLNVVVCQIYIPHVTIDTTSMPLYLGGFIYCNVKWSVCSSEHSYFINANIGIKNLVSSSNQTIRVESNFGGYVRVGCKVKYQGRELNSMVSTIRVETPPGRTTIYNGQRVATIGDILVCHAECFPSATYNWVLRGSDVIRIYNNPILTLPRSMREGYFTITCIAKNYLGSNYSSINVEFFNSYNKLKPLNLIFILAVVIIACAYFFCLSLILSMVFSESVYRVHSKIEKRKPQKVITERTLATESDSDDEIKTIINEEHSNLNNPHGNSSNLSAKKAKQKKFKSLCAKYLSLYQKKLLISCDVVLCENQANTSNVINSVDYLRSNLLTRSFNEFLLEEAPGERRKKIIEEILSLKPNKVN